MKKSIKIILGIFLVLIIIGVGSLYYLNSNLQLDESPAILYPTSSVLVQRDSQTITVSQKYELQKDDIIKTSNDGAKVVFYDSVYVFLDPNTQVSLAELQKDNIQLNQNSGSTWNKITKLFNAKNYRVKTPNSVASVRGTEFEIRLGENNDTTVTLVDGKVEINDGKKKVVIDDYGKAKVDNEGIVKVEFTKEERDALVKKVREMTTALKDNRKDMAQRLLNKNSATISKVESIVDTKIDINAVQDYFDQVDSGKKSFEELKKSIDEKVPFVKTGFINDFESISNDIQKQEVIINKIQNN